MAITTNLITLSSLIDLRLGIRLWGTSRNNNSKFFLIIKIKIFNIYHFKKGRGSQAQPETWNNNNRNIITTTT